MTNGDKILFMQSYPISTCLAAFVKDDTLENKIQHLSSFACA